jgi:hypothetical protein
MNFTKNSVYWNTAPITNGLSVNILNPYSSVLGETDDIFSLKLRTQTLWWVQNYTKTHLQYFLLPFWAIRLQNLYAYMQNKFHKHE